MASSSRWRGMGAREAQSYASERKDFLKAASKGADWKPAFRDASKVFGLNVLGQIFKGIGKSGKVGMMNETINRVTEDQSDIFNTVDQMNPYLSFLQNFEGTNTKIKTAGFDPTIPWQRQAYFHSLADTDVSKAFKNKWQSFPGGDANITAKRGMAEELINRSDTIAKERAENLIKTYDNSYNLLQGFKTREGTVLTSAIVDRKLKAIQERIMISTEQNLTNGQYIDPSFFDVAMYQFGFKDGDMRKNVITGVKDELIEKGLVRRLSFKIEGTEADEEYERLINNIITNWKAISHKVPEAVKDKTLEAIAIENNLDADPSITKEDVQNATNNLETITGITSDYPNLASGLGDLITTKEEAKLPSKEQRDALIVQNIDKLGILDRQLANNEIEYADYRQKYDDLVYNEIGLSSLRAWMKTNQPESEMLNQMKNTLFNEISSIPGGISGLNPRRLDLFKTLVPTAFGNIYGTKGNKLSVNTTSESFIERIGAAQINDVNMAADQYLGATNLDEVIEGQADKLVELGYLKKGAELNTYSEEAKAWIAARKKFITTEVQEGQFGNQLRIMQRAISSSPVGQLHMATYNATVVQDYIDQGITDLGAILDMAKVDTLSAFFGVKGTGGWFGTTDKIFAGIANPTIGMGKDSTWAKLLGVNYLYDDATDKNAAIDRGVIDYSEIKNDKVRKDIGDILFNFADWENATGKYAPGSETPSSNRVKNKVDRYVALRKFAEILAEQPSQGSQITNRLNIAIDSTDKLLNLGRTDYDLAYDQLRKSLINEMTMYNIAFFKNIKIDLSTFEGGEEAEDLVGNIQENLSTFTKEDKEKAKVWADPSDATLTTDEIKEKYNLESIEDMPDDWWKNIEFTPDVVGITENGLHYLTKVGKGSVPVKDYDKKWGKPEGFETPASIRAAETMITGGKNWKAKQNMSRYGGNLPKLFELGLLRRAAEEGYVKQEDVDNFLKKSLLAKNKKVVN